jgi:hypothetical protein
VHQVADVGLVLRVEVGIVHDYVLAAAQRRHDQHVPYLEGKPFVVLAVVRLVEHGPQVVAVDALVGPRVLAQEFPGKRTLAAGRQSFQDPNRFHIVRRET